MWLSKETNIDEVSALRIAALEWQSRSAAQLLRGSPGEQVASVNGGRGVNQFQTSFFDPGTSLISKSSFLGDGEPVFEENSARRQRLLENYLSERRYILKTSEYITFGALCSVDVEFADREQHRSSWLEEVGESILSAWSLQEPLKGTPQNLVVNAVDALRSRLHALENGSGWLLDEDIQEEIELAWARSQLVESIHIMRIVLNLLESSSKLMNAPAILPWFKLMNECGFFESLQLVSANELSFDQSLTFLTATSKAPRTIRYTTPIACSPRFPCCTSNMEDS